SVAAAVTEQTPGEADTTYLPVSVEAIRVFPATIGRRARCYAELSDLDADGKLGHAVLTDDAGTPLAELDGIYLRRVQRRTVPLPWSQTLFLAGWQSTAAPQPRDDAAAAGSWWLLSAGAADTAAYFSRRFAAPQRRLHSATLGDEPA